MRYKNCDVCHFSKPRTCSGKKFVCDECKRKKEESKDRSSEVEPEKK